MRSDIDGMSIVRAELCDRLDSLRAAAGKTNIRELVGGIATIRTLASAYGMIAVVCVADAFERAIRAEPRFCPAGLYFDRLRDAYVDLLSDSIEFYDEVAVKELGRSPRHVLLLHENDLAALYLGDLVKRLRKTGWKIVSPELAFQDPIAKVEPDTLLLGQGRVIALAAAKGYQGPSRRWEDEAMLQQEFERRRVWE